MNIILIHGDHVQQSLERLDKLIDVARHRGWDISRITDSDKSLPEHITSPGLFSSNRLLIFENFNNLPKSDTRWLKDNAKNFDVTLLIYHQGIVAPTKLKQFDITKREEYKLPKKIWNFLDSFFPGNSKMCLILFHQVIETEAVEFVFSLLSTQLRNLYWVKKDAKSLKLQSWRVGKLKRQASKFDNDKLKNIIDELAKIDIKVKTSKAELPQLLDLLIITKLE